MAKKIKVIVVDDSAFIQGQGKITIPPQKNFKINKEISHRVTTGVENVLGRNIEAVVIGASTGGPKALYQVITALPSDIGVPILVVQHMPVGFTKAFADRMNLNSKLKVTEARDGELIEKNVVYIAPGGYHMEVGSGKRIQLNTDPTIWGVRPAVDKLFISATKVYGAHLLSVILTGMGRDGAKGTAAIKDNGGITIVEHESTCIIYGMPKAAFETGKVDEIVPLPNIAGDIKKIVMGR